MSRSLRTPQERFPRGWFQIGWSHELEIGDVKPLHYFGQDLVMFRTESGVVGVLDAHCQHMGANIGVGGKVDGESVQCPWHGWRWSTDGSNTLIPYSSEGCKKNVKVRSWHVREWYGMIVAWHDWDPGGEPYWEPPAIPEFDSGEFYPLHPYSDHVWKVRCHPQMPLENAVDFAHIEYVHGHQDPPELADFRTDGHWMQADVEVEYGRGRESTWLTPDGPVTATIEIQGFGIGFGMIRFTGMWPTVQVSSITPIDEEYSAYFFQQASKRIDDDGDEPKGIAKLMIDLQVHIIPQDFFTWENMTYLETPNLAAEESKAFLDLRRWCKQFYPSASPNDPSAVAEMPVASPGR